MCIEHWSHARNLTKGFTLTPDTRREAASQLHVFIRNFGKVMTQPLGQFNLVTIDPAVSGADCEEGHLRPFSPYLKMNREVFLGWGPLITLEMKPDITHHARRRRVQGR